ncbi:MAG: oxygen-independent coproporphyrinogen III oxidase [Paracoccaceae bacterium]|nr:oxygen-independent coproporphyrinogen III oxidase [Paracoccaceae bacterium]
MHMSSKLAKLGLFDAMVPRYTSYPTAPHFNTDVASGHVQSWIASIPAHSTISLYLHIPFCRSLCWFCACRTQGAPTLSPIAKYVETVRQEVALLGQFLPEGVTLSRMHWGGGTPTLLSAEMIDALSDAIDKIAPLAPDADFSVEIDVKEIDSARIDALVRAGLTRACIGVQDFDPEIQSTIGRIQGFEVTRDATETLRASNVKSLNADILFGLPHQNETRIATSVQKLLTLNPDRVALYGYAHVPWMARRQCMIPSDTLPTPEKRLALFETGRRLLDWDGYRQVGIDHFARPEDSLTKAAESGNLRRSFQGYTDDPSSVLIGLGASAISRYPQGFAQNYGATSDYAAAIGAGGFATHKGHALTREDKLRARIIESILCDFGVNNRSVAAEFPDDTALAARLLQDLAGRFGDMVRLSEDGLHIKPEAQPLARNMARHFDAYDMSTAGHATAV